MEESALRPYEERALAAERRIQVIEDKLAASSALVGLNAQRYIAELEQLREVLLLAKAEQDALQQRVTQLETANMKLEYRVKHLCRSLEDTDAKLAEATGIAVNGV